MMKTFTLILLTVTGSVVLPAQPKLTIVGGASFDFGEIYTTQPVKKVVTLRNDGNETLIISDISTTCGCTTAPLTNDHIASGQTANLEIAFDGTRFQGKISKAVSFETNDTAQKRVHITFTANVNRIVSIDPSDYLNFYMIPIDSAVTQQITIQNEDDSPLRIISVKADSDVLSCTAKEHQLSPNDETTIDCRLLSHKTGLFKGNITITTDNPKVPHISLRFVAYVKNKPAQATNSQGQ